MGATTDDMRASDHFRAFVSYSHADARFAHKLHRKMETYRMPSRFRKGSTGVETGLADGRLGKIFRDREDLPASQDLSQAVKDALFASQALIVLCSPDAKSSPWVSQEIDLFRSLHPDRPILAALIRGEPEESFPEPLLRGREPLAADLRKEGDGWRLGFLKIVAGIAGVSLDSLVQRDAQRRMQRVIAVTLVVATGLLAMIGMTIFAIQSRNEAQRQQTEAEGLVEYMLTDLRADLKGVGRLDVMTDVNERAMKYYKSQKNISDMSPESLERRAKILLAWGEDDFKRGDHDDALIKFGEVNRTTRVLLEQDPKNPDRIFGHAQSEYWVGYIAYLREDWEQAEKHWSAYKTHTSLLLAIDNDEPRWRREAGYAEGNLCTLGLHRKDGSISDNDPCRTALKHMQSVLMELPNDKNAILDVANRHAWVGDALKAAGQISESVEERRKQHDLLDNLSLSLPNNYQVKDELIRAKISLSEGLRDLGHEVQALKINSEANNLAASLTQRDPKNRRWKILEKRTDDFKT